MATGVYRIQFSANLYGDPSQNTTNTWYFIGLPGTTVEEDVAEAFGRLSTFYLAIDNTVYPSAVVSPTAKLIAYNMGDPEPRTPIGEVTVGLTLGGSAAYPSDVAICLSYRSAYPSGVNRARRRGRVYLGPVLAAVATPVAGQGQRVAPAVISTILTAAQGLADQQVTPLLWAMYSETDNQAWPIEEASIDNGFDTRRSRDNRATTRTAVAVG